MSAAKKIPPLRFKGFEGAWKSYEFGGVYERINAKKYQIESSRYLNLGCFPVVDQGKDLIVAYTNDANKVFPAAESPVIVFGDHTREVKFVEFDFAIGADGTQLMRCCANFEISFAYYVMKRLTLPNMGYSRHYKFLLEAQYLFPNLREQQKIASAFRSLDALIADRELAVEKLQTLKKAMLEKMFPRSGAKVPEVRFKGFEGAWGKVRLDNVCTMFSGGTPTSTNHTFYGGDIDWVSISDMTKSGKYITETEKKLTQEGFENCSAKMFPPSTLLFAMYASIGKCCIASESVCSSQAILGLYNLDDVDVEFLYYDLSRREKMFSKMGQTGSQANLSKAIVSEIKVNMPPTFEEQRKIGAYFRSLDALISARQEEVGKLTDLKKALLDRMFV